MNKGFAVVIGPVMDPAGTYDVGVIQAKKRTNSARLLMAIRRTQSTVTNTGHASRTSGLEKLTLKH